MKYVIQLLTVGLFVLTGCRQLDSLYDTKVVLTTNYVNHPTTNAAGVVFLNTVAEIKPKTVLVELNPQAVMVKDYAHFIPAPYGELAFGFIGLLASAYAFMRNRSRKKVVGTLTEGMEVVKTALEKEAPKVKEAAMVKVIALQEARGVREEIKEHL